MGVAGHRRRKETRRGRGVAESLQRRATVDRVPDGPADTGVAERRSAPVEAEVERPHPRSPLHDRVVVGDHAAGCPHESLEEDVVLAASPSLAGFSR
jgi:hypothetical protein